ncbi:chloramphenicol resistance protein [Purpureocillium lavendulum]|uniref:Chloramphenicol resistance protein n=1 Tax=Purpureocillium lavendulum TaxID=1247861 RepID=A0AB34FYS9_9HYPO|nr:chloramphenicol resistance protein [Purpureocillium lavendulum]
MKDDAAGPGPSAGDKQVALEDLGHASTHPTVSEMDTLGRKSTTLDDPVDAVTTAEPIDDAGVLQDVEPATRVSSGTPYSAFARGTKIWITVMVTISSVVSPMTANVYYPALNVIAEDLDVSISLINLTLTTYMIFQGLSPTFFGDFGDMAGRRPAFIVAFAIYLCANIGLALQRDYAALMVLRCLQSAGSSGTLALGFAVMADISSTDERGRYMGFVNAGINFGPTIGPVLGGILIQFLGWRSVFWFCAIFVFVWLIPWILAVPETCRAVVGNGSIPPPKWNMTLVDFIRWRGVHQRPASAPKVKIRMPNPLRTLYIVFRKEEGLILFVSAIIYVNFILVSATLATLFKEIYKFDELEVGLCYLPYGIGCCLASLVSGYIVDWNYRRVAKKLGLPVRRRKGDDLNKFPIEHARIQIVYPALAVGAACLIGWGWALEAEISVAVPLVLAFFIGCLVPPSFSILNTLIVDLNPEAPATAAAANNLVRCSFGAVATAVIDYMLDAMGRGWCFTFLAVIMLLCFIGLRVLENCGPRWRAERSKKVEREETQEK